MGRVAPQTCVQQGAQRQRAIGHAKKADWVCAILPRVAASPRIVPPTASAWSPTLGCVTPPRLPRQRRLGSAWMAPPPRAWAPRATHPPACFLACIRPSHATQKTPQICLPSDSGRSNLRWPSGHADKRFRSPWPRQAGVRLTCQGSRSPADRIQITQATRRCRPVWTPIENEKRPTECVYQNNWAVGSGWSCCRLIRSSMRPKLLRDGLLFGMRAPNLEQRPSRPRPAPNNGFSENKRN